MNQKERWEKSSCPCVGSTLLFLMLLFAFPALAQDTQPFTLPRCVVKAVVQAKLRREATTRTYEVTSYHWGEEAVALHIRRDKFSFVAYESARQQSLRYWYHGWDDSLLEEGLYGSSGLPSDYLSLAPFGILYRAFVPGAIPEDEERVTVSAWKKATESSAHSVWVREWTRTFGPQSFLTKLDGVTTLALSSNQPQFIENHYAVHRKSTPPVLHIGDKTVFENYTDNHLPLPRHVTHVVLDNPARIVQVAECHVVATRELSPQETPDSILPQLTQGLAAVRRLPHYKPTAMSGASLVLRSIIGSRIPSIVLGLGFVAILWWLVRRFRLI